MKKFSPLLFLILWSCIVHSENDCKEEWNTLLTKVYETSGPDEMITHWLGLKNSCKKSDFYFLRLGWLFVEVGKFDEAEKAFDNGLKLNGENKASLELGKTDLIFQRATRNRKSADEKLLKLAESKMNEYIKRNPKRSDALALMSGIMLVKGDFHATIDVAKKALALGEESVAYRNMAIASARLYKVEETLEAALKALELTKSFEGDKDLMLAASMAYVELGELNTALGVLLLLVEKNPAMKQDPLVNELGAKLQKKIKENTPST